MLTAFSPRIEKGSSLTSEVEPASRLDVVCLGPLAV